MLDVEALESDFDFWLSLLPEERKQKCLRYVFLKDHLLSLGASLLIEAFVGKGPYLYNEFGKPYKENAPFFSVSHSGTKVLLAVSSKEVGADIERIGEKDPALATHCFDEEERTHIKTQEDFFSAWCEKEALGKMRGFGIKDPKKTPVRLSEDNKVCFEGREAYVQKGLLDGYAYAIAAEEEFETEFHHPSLGQLGLMLK